MTSVIRDTLEKEIATLLLDKLEQVQITPERAAEIARFALTALPGTLTEDQAIKLIPSLDDRFVELASIVHKYLSKDEDSQRTKITQQAQDLINKGHMDQATQLMKEYFSGKII
jgi:hypothetical protein